MPQRMTQMQRQQPVQVLIIYLMTNRVTRCREVGATAAVAVEAPIAYHYPRHHQIKCTADVHRLCHQNIIYRTIRPAGPVFQIITKIHTFSNRLHPMPCKRKTIHSRIQPHRHRYHLLSNSRPHINPTRRKRLMKKAISQHRF